MAKFLKSTDGKAYNVEHIMSIGAGPGPGSYVVVTMIDGSTVIPGFPRTPHNVIPIENLDEFAALVEGMTA